jgi:cytochrome P450
MYPIWILMRQALVDVDLGGVTVPKGVDVTLSPHALHFDPRYHRDPDRFDPDRWLPERAATVPKGAYLPFGMGGRQCIGNIYAQTEITIAMATIAARWRLVPVPGKTIRTKVTSAPYPNRMPMTAVPRSQ